MANELIKQEGKISAIGTMQGLDQQQQRSGKDTLNVRRHFYGSEGYPGFLQRNVENKILSRGECRAWDKLVQERKKKSDGDELFCVCFKNLCDMRHATNLTSNMKMNVDEDGRLDMEDEMNAAGDVTGHLGLMKK